VCSSDLNNVAAFSLDLTPDGAAFMEQTLVGPDGQGASNLTPIQVAYEMKMMVKLPPARMHVQFNTASLYHSCQELFHEHTNCSDDYFTSENLMTTALEAGLVTIKIDAGGIEDEDTVQMLTQQATSMVQEMLTDRFATKERAPAEE
jgi:formiminotetrahydrofolate cyclodeaminase